MTLLTTMNTALDTTLQELSMSRSLSELGDALERLARERSGCPHACYYEYRADENVLHRPHDEAFTVADDTLPGACATRWQEVHVAKLAEARPMPGVEGRPEHALALPVRLNGTLVGVLVAAGSPISDEAADRLRDLAQMAGPMQAFVNTRADLGNLLTHTQDLLVKGVEALVGKGHVTRVARLTSGLGVLLDLSSRSRELLWQAAHYHDVGWLILQGQNRYEIEDRHAQAGAAYLSSVRALRELAPLVESHHERWDGSGYPRGLSGEQVSIEGWTLALAEDLAEHLEAADADKRTARDVIAEFFAQRSSLHHPAVLDALSGLIDAGQLDEVFEHRT